MFGRTRQPGAHSRAPHAVGGSPPFMKQTTSLRLGTDTFENPVLIDPEARPRHVYVVGQTGTGKSVALRNMAAQDAQNGQGFCFIDPHSSNAELLLSHIPTERAHEVVYLSPSDLSRPIGLNFMGNVPRDRRSLVVENMLASFIHFWGETLVGPQSQEVLRNSLRALMDSQGATLLSVMRLLRDAEYRQIILKRTEDPLVRSYWRDKFALYEEEERNRVVSPITNKLNAFLDNPALRNVLSQLQNTIDVRKIMDDGRILIVNLSKGRLGELSAGLFGALCVSHIAQCAFSRDDTPEDDRTPFHIYADEFQLYATDSFAAVLSEARKYGLTLTLAHQFLQQVPKSIHDAVMGNAGTVISFRVGPEDADVISHYFGINAAGLRDLKNHTAVMRPLRKGVPGTEVVIGMDAPRPPLHNLAAELMTNSARRFGRDRAEVEARIARFMS